MARNDASLLCIKLGKEFVSNFHIMYQDYKQLSVESYILLCVALQENFNIMNDIVLKYCKNHLTFSKKLDWFYSFGSSYEEYFNDDAESEVYEYFIDELESSKNVMSALTNTFVDRNDI